MILNVSGKPFERFSVSQTLALKGESVTTQDVSSIEEFEVLFAKIKDVSMVLVDSKNFILTNDILNFVSCKVVTLDVVIVDGVCNFIEYGTTD